VNFTGARIGQALHDLAAKARVTARAASLPGEIAAETRRITTMWEQAERSLAGIGGQIVKEALSSEEMPEQLRDLLSTLENPSQQWQAIFLFVGILGFSQSLGQALMPGRIQSLANLGWRQAPTKPLPAAVAAEAWVKRKIGFGTAATWSHEDGFGDLQFDTLARLAELPPSVGEAMEGLRRGFLDVGGFNLALTQAGVDPGWHGLIHQLVYGPPSPAEAVQAAVQGHLTEDQSKRIASEGGLDPAHYPWLLATHGDPPGVQELIHLWRRGDVTEATVEAAIRESRIKNKYIEPIKHMRYVLPPQRTVRSLVAKGVIDRGRGIDLLQKIGWFPDLAAALIDEALATKHEKHRDLAETQVVAAYEDKLIARGEATDMLHKLGYDGHGVDLILHLADDRAAATIRKSSISRIATLYIRQHIDRSTASTDLDTIHTPVEQRDHLLQMWDLERAASIPHLTHAEVTRAMTAGIIDEAEARRRLVGMGYVDADVNILIGLVSGGRPPVRRH
jgi:hypothetical protein